MKYPLIRCMGCHFRLTKKGVCPNYFGRCGLLRRINELEHEASWRQFGVWREQA